MIPNVKQAILNVLIQASLLIAFDVARQCGNPKEWFWAFIFASYILGAVFGRALLSKPNPKDVRDGE